MTIAHKEVDAYQYLIFRERERETGKLGDKHSKRMMMLQAHIHIPRERHFFVLSIAFLRLVYREIEGGKGEERERTHREMGRRIEVMIPENSTTARSRGGEMFWRPDQKRQSMKRNGGVIVIASFCISMPLHLPAYRRTCFPSHYVREITDDVLGGDRFATVWKSRSPHMLDAVQRVLIAWLGDGHMQA